MKSALLGGFFLLTFLSSAYGWGYIFSRFRPEANNNWGGYGGAGLAAPQERLTPREQLMEALLGEEILEEEVCSGRRCTSNEHCCPDHVCMNFDSNTGGRCLPVGSQHACASDLDCDDGYACEMGSCSTTERKGFNEPCMVSSECDFGKGLCCQFIRRHRQAPKKLCSYFKDPLNCIGHVEVAEEKRSRPSQ